MISFKFDDERTIRDIEQRLGGLRNKAPKVMCTALNNTAKKARTILGKTAREKYDMKAKDFTKEMALRSASPARLMATLRTSGHAVELIHYKSNPSAYVPGRFVPVVSARVLKTSAMKPLVNNGIKAFVMKFQSGHTTIMERTTSKRLPIKALYGPSIPQIIGSEENVYGLVRVDIETILKQNVDRQIARVLANQG